MTKILCVAEKPAIARGVAQHLSGGSFRTHNIQGNQYVKNYEFDFTFSNVWGRCTVVMTSVLGHLTSCDFAQNYRGWNSCHPRDLFAAPVNTFVDKDRQAIADNIARQARAARALFIWTDCDREGEHIGAEIREAALRGKQSLEIRRARFSNTERAHVMHAAQNPVELDQRQVDAVAARIELDLRIGAALTRWQTQMIQRMQLAQIQERQVVSYGSCQFPTLGFVVDRYFHVRDFVPEAFWYIELHARRDDIDVKFSWDRNRLFDRMAAVLLYERALDAGFAQVTKLNTRPSSKRKPLPLTTVELQRLGALFLRMESSHVMKIAEDLYTRGFISYPRTETDQFDSNFDLHALIAKQTQDRQWGTYAQSLLEDGGGFQQPRKGRNNDRAHPPIHPVNFVERSGLSGDEARVYEFVTRRFLACCSDDAHGETTTVNIQMGAEGFHATGLRVIERNYLDVYVYDKWESSQPLPHFKVGDVFEPGEVSLREGKTTPPGYLTEPELIALMDANGIGTDATMAEHISKIKSRQYVITRPRGGTSSARGGRGGGARGSRGAGSRGGRGGRSTAANNGENGSSSSGGGAGNQGLLEFIPSTLGTALIKGYDNIKLETSLGKPFLRKEMEAQMKEICAGQRSKVTFIDQTLEKWQEVFVKVESEVGTLKAAVTRYVVNGGRDTGTGTGAGSGAGTGTGTRSG